MIVSETDLSGIIRSCFQHPESIANLTQFDGAFRPYLMAILTGIYRGDSSLAEDAYQSAFIKYIEIFKAGFKPGINYEPYFIVIAKNCLIDEIRRMNRYVAIDDVFSEEVAQGGIDQSHLPDTKLIVLEGMMLLPRRCQYILESYYIAEIPVAELAKNLRISSQSVYMTVKRCRDELRNILSGNVRK